MKELYYLYTGDTGYSDRRRGPHDRLTNTKNIWGDCSNIFGNCTYIKGYVTSVTGDISGLTGDVTHYEFHATGLFGEVTSWDIEEVEIN
jgi:hypothetical protein